MIHSSADLLEFPAVRRLVGRWVASPPGRRALAAVEPTDDSPALEETLAETAEAVAYLDAAAQPQPAARGSALRPRFGSVPDCEASLARLAIEGAVLEGAEILALTALLDVAGNTRSALRLAGARFPRLVAIGDRIADFGLLTRDFGAKLLPGGLVADHASPVLARVRREIDRQQRAIQESLERFLRVHRDDGVLQEDFVAIRNDRFVIPVVPGQRRRVEGVIHGASGSGHTLFLEPLETIELNNDLVRLREEEAREVHRILAEMTARLRESAADIEAASEAVGALDLLFAKAEFAREFGCTVPKLSPPDAPRLALREARHPLLEDVLRRRGRHAVPFSLTLDGARRTLLISGPNTGGKTVTLKTAGLIVLMAQAGLPVPCAEAETPLFALVLADMGDNQSIEESLSTFSAHMQRVREMLDLAEPGALALLDEPGRATDPDEGGALGVAILDHFRRAGAFTLASTHLMAIKTYGATEQGVVNASMSFDDDTLEPTYRLDIGAPGRSAGLEIAARLGLPAALIDRARATMTSAQRDVADYLRLLRAETEAARDRAGALERERSAMEEERRGLAREWEKRESAKLREIDRRAEETLAKFEREARETIAKIGEEASSRKAGDRAQRRVAQARRELREEIVATVPPSSPQAPPSPIREGARVRLRDVRGAVPVRRVFDDGTIEVEAGVMKLRVAADDVVEVLPDAPPAPPRGVSVHAAARTGGVPRELNVIGRSSEEALEEVDKFLDTAAMASVERVRIVHGHGMGILKKAIARLLAGHPHVAKSYEAPPREGGAGATLVELKGEGE